MRTDSITKPGSNRCSAVGRWEQVEVSALRSAERLTRKHPGAKRRSVEASIREYGILDPVTINGAGVIVDGHLRVDIARKLGFRTVPVIRIEHLSDIELRGYALAANKLPGVASYDIESLRIELEEIRADAPSLDLTLTGFTIGEVDRISNNHLAGMYDDLDEDEQTLPPEPPLARPGDLYALGDHRLICGDSLDFDVLAKVMDGERATCCFTDPPYNVKINGHVSGSGKHAEFAMASGEMSRPEFETFLLTALANIEAQMRDGGIAFVCMDHAHLGELLLAGDAVFDRRLNICTWDKGRGGMGSLYRSQAEHIAVFKKGFVPHINNVELGKHGRNRTNIWPFPGMAGFGKGRKKALELHPTVKPVGLVGEAILDVSAPGDLVLDPFGGSGTTLIAAERISRRARLVEFDPVYVDRTVARWEKMTGEKAVLLDRVADQPGEDASSVADSAEAR
jgi:DNA modification methylase